MVAWLEDGVVLELGQQRQRDLLAHVGYLQFRAGKPQVLGGPDAAREAVGDEPGRLVVPASSAAPPAACRQLASSARRRVRASQAPAAPAARQAGIIRAFKRAWEAKDIDALIGLLDPGATATADGGGLATSFLHPIEGGEQIARAWVEIANRAAGTMTFLERTVNGQAGLVAQQDGRTVTVFAFDVAGDLIRHIWVVRNPDKLRPWAAS